MKKQFKHIFNLININCKCKYINNKCLNWEDNSNFIIELNLISIVISKIKYLVNNKF